MISIPRDKIAGALYGCALGDALGRPTEFMRLKDIHKAYGKSGYMRLPEPALFTDDTQMTIAIARALDDARCLKPRELTRTLTNRFVEWKLLDEPRAPGMTCMKSIQRLQEARVKHRSWQWATTVSRGCGANMRVLPTALLGDFEVAMGASQLQAALTHGDPIALAATELTALAIRWAAHGTKLQTIPVALLQYARTRGLYRQRWLGRLSQRWGKLSGQEIMNIAYERLAGGLHATVKLLDNDARVSDVCRILGEAWTADEALYTSLYFAARYGADPELAISEAARTSGDSDSIACITGAIVGARYGESVWPLAWRQRIERRRHLEQAIDVITRLS